MFCRLHLVLTIVLAIVSQLGQPLIISGVMAGEFLPPNAILDRDSTHERNLVLDTVQAVNDISVATLELPVGLPIGKLTALAVCAIAFQSLCVNYEFHFALFLFHCPVSNYTCMLTPPCGDVNHFF